MNSIPESKLKTLRKVIKDKGSLAVAYSGGIDSTLISKIAYEQLGDRSMAVTIKSESYSKRELEVAETVAAEIGIAHEVVAKSELQNNNYVQNPVNRCYFCKKSEMATLRQVARKNGIEHVAFGVNMSDFGEHRPGLKALEEDEAFHPLVAANLNKSEITALAEHLGLSNHDLPSTTCLASRIPYGQRITLEKLNQIEQAEELLFQIGISQSRVRNYGDMARIEVPREEISLLLKHRESIISTMKQLGFSYITLDLEGYRSGSMNEVL